MEAFQNYKQSVTAQYEAYEQQEKEAYESALNVLNFTEANYQHDFKWKIDWNDLDEKLIEMRSIILTEMQKKL